MAAAHVPGSLLVKACRLLRIPGVGRTGVDVNPTCCQSTTRATSAPKIVPNGGAPPQIKPLKMIPRLVTLQWQQPHQSRVFQER